MSHYPEALMNEYHELVTLKMRKTATHEEMDRVLQVRYIIAEYDEERMVGTDIWDVQHDKIKEELRLIREEVEALPDMG
jgi:hypothetical protein